MLGGGSYADLLSNISMQLDVSASKALVVVRTALYGFSRTINARLAQALGLEWFWYAGPDDSVTRPWCAKFVGTRVTAEILQAHANDADRGSQPSAPITTWLGGYNCRHQLVPLLPNVINQYPEGPR